jgi:hypothetical protein
VLVGAGIERFEVTGLRGDPFAAAHFGTVSVIFLWSLFVAEVTA